MLVKTRGHAVCVEVMWLFDTWCDFREVAWPCSDVTFGGVMWLRAGARTTFYHHALVGFYCSIFFGAKEQFTFYHPEWSHLLSCCLQLHRQEDQECSFCAFDEEEEVRRGPSPDFREKMCDPNLLGIDMKQKFEPLINKAWLLHGGVVYPKNSFQKYTESKLVTAPHLIKWMFSNPG